jgi:hypothetical protein
MALDEMNISAIDGNRNEANHEILSDEGVRKVIRISPRGKKLSVGDTFDVTLHFEWQAHEAEPNDFDGFNLMNIRYPVRHFVYRVTYPWKAAKIAVWEFVLERQDAKCAINEDTEKVPPGSTNLTIDFGAPRPVAYLICFSQKLRDWL